MRIAFVGKGGSGKTSLAALVARTLAAEGKTVLAIDADINQQLAETLGMDAAAARVIPPLGNEVLRLKEYVRGTNPRIQSAAVMLKTTPPGSGSRLLTVGPNAIVDHFARKHEGVAVMVTGGFVDDDVGVKCYHSKTGAVELLLNHLADARDEYVIVDMTAGSDAFASGLFAQFDCTCIVVEPTRQSAAVYQQYRTYAAPYDVPLVLVANKVENTADLVFITTATGSAPHAVFDRSGAIREHERSRTMTLADFEPAVRAAAATLIAHIAHTVPDWRRRYALAKHFHTRNAESWGSAAVGADTTLQIDPEFDLADAVCAQRPGHTVPGALATSQH